MKPLLDAFWRAAAYCLHPRVILLSILPLIAMEAVFRAIRELAETLFELGRVLRIGRDARAHHGRLRIPEFEQHLRFLP